MPLMPLVPESPMARKQKLTETDRQHIAILDALRLWSKQSIADAYGVDRVTVRHCTLRYLPEWS